jgi:hypothetical protein
MAKVNVYLPDDLEREVRDAGLPMSPVCQAALRESLDRLAALRSRTVGLDRLVAHTGRGRFTSRLADILTAAAEDAEERNRQVTPHDLLGAILDHGDNLGAAALEAAGLDLPTPGFLRRGRSAAKGTGELSAEVRAALALAFTIALELRHEHLGAEHVVIALATEPSPTAPMFAALGLDPRTLRTHVERLLVRLLADR